MEQLTGRELEVLTLLAGGLSDKQIAARLQVQPATVRTHVAHIKLKLKVTTRTELGILLALAVHLWDAVPAEARDYTPVIGYNHGVGPSGGLVQTQGTPLDPNDTVQAWNAWTGKSKLAVGTAGCGTTASCVIFANDGENLLYTTCQVPQALPGARATTFIRAGPYYYNFVCNYGTESHPLFAVAFDNERTDQGAYLLHIQRHETGHGLRLWDANEACWSENWFWWPLMNNALNAPCAAYGSNYTATYNEAVYASLLNGW